jgi:hypothetical protein
MPVPPAPAQMHVRGAACGPLAESRGTRRADLSPKVEAHTHEARHSRIHTWAFFKGVQKEMSLRAADPLAQAQQRKTCLILRHCCNGMTTRLTIPIRDPDIFGWGLSALKKIVTAPRAQGVAFVVHRLPHSGVPATLSGGQ